MGRPKGSKNKFKRDDMSDQDTSNESKESTETTDESTSEVKTKPVVQEKGGVTVAMDEEAEILDSYGGDCQNCLNHGEKNGLLPNGTCSVCGFDKTKLYGAF